MKLVHLEGPSIVLALSETLDVEQAWRVRRGYRPDSCVIRLCGMTSTAHGRSAFTDGCYEADGLSCVRLLWWIIGRRPGASARAIKNAFDRLFIDNPDDAIKAALSIFAATDWRSAPGEAAFFSARQWQHHPFQMSALERLGAAARTV